MWKRSNLNESMQSKIVELKTARTPIPHDRYWSSKSVCGQAWELYSENDGFADRPEKFVWMEHIAWEKIERT